MPWKEMADLLCNTLYKMLVLLKEGIICWETPTFKGHTEKTGIEGG